MTLNFSVGKFVVLLLGLTCVMLGTRSYDLTGISWKNMLCLFIGVIILYLNSVIVETQHGKKQKNRR